MPPVVTDVTPDLNPTIKLTFQGLVLAHFDEQIAQVGAVVSNECHRPKITITKKRNGKYESEINLGRLLDIDQNLFTEDIHLDVFETGQSGISTFQKGPFDRGNKDLSNSKDFRWFIDIAKEIFQVEEPLAIDRTKILPVFHVQNAVFYSDGPSRDKCVIKRADDTEDPFGFITGAIHANVTLDRLSSNAVLRSGDRKIFAIDAGHIVQGITYEIMFDCDCPEAAKPEGNETDFKLIFGALGTDLSASDRVDLLKLDSDTGSSTNHEVPCGGGKTGSPLRIG